MSESIVVIGAGLAAPTAVETLRAEGFTGSITLVGDEPDRPYARPPLSKQYLQGTSAAEDLFVHPSAWYADHDVETRFDDAAVSFDCGNRLVTLASGEQVGYQQLLLATGASPRNLSLPGIDLDGVVSLRRIGDSDRIRAALGTATRGGHHRRRLDRTGDRRGGAVRAGGELLPADLVVVAVGVTPTTALAAAAGLTIGDGIVVDERLRTTDPAVFAAGDVASAFNTALGTSLRVEHWDNAIRQRRLAARSMLGADAVYDWQPYFYTDQFELGMEYVGHGSPSDRVVIRGDRQAGEFIAFWLADGLVTAAMNVNVWEVQDELRALVGSRMDPARLADPDIALADLRG